MIWSGLWISCSEVYISNIKTFIIFQTVRAVAHSEQAFQLLKRFSGSPEWPTYRKLVSVQYPKSLSTSLAAAALGIVVRIEEVFVCMGHSGGIILLVLQINDIIKLILMRNCISGFLVWRNCLIFCKISKF